MTDAKKGLQDLLASLSTGAADASSRRDQGLEPNGGNDSSPSAHSYTAGMSMPATKRARSEQPDQSTNLLNLLRFNSSNAAQGSPLPSQGSPVGVGSQATTQNIHGRGVSSSDLVASFMGKPTISHSARNATPASIPDVQGNGGANPQDYLLQLLNRNPSSQSRVPLQRAATPAPEVMPLSASTNTTKSIAQRKSSTSEEPGRQDSPIRVFGSQASRENTPFEPEVASKGPISSLKPASPAIFNYVNPFDQLAAASPRNGRSGTTTPAVKEIPAKQTSNNRGEIPIMEAPNGSLNANGHDILESIEGSSPKLTSTVDRLVGIGAPTENKETVAQALNEVGEQVNRQVEYALAQQQAQEDGQEEQQDLIAVQSIEKQLQQAAAEVKKELDGGDTKNTLGAVMSNDDAAKVKKVINEAAAGHVDLHHGSADDEESSGNIEEAVDVPVYNLPMRPFVSIDIQGDQPTGLAFRESSITDIARLKKEFDQIDRTLATASNNYIVYSLPKPGGFRIIRQDDGLDRQAFKETKDHVFNVAISNEVHNRMNKIGLETCIATAISGNVYWVTLRKAGEDLLASDEFQRNSLVFPPVPVHDDNTSGGPLKTRAKKSSRHPDYFAIGRGKSIQIVYPIRAQTSQYVSNGNVVDTAKYLQQFSLRINMGKAGKDFNFSEDDTVIATLDKSGRLRLWDITALTDRADADSQSYNLELTQPVLSFPTTSGASKSWPTSVLFVDKPRAYIKGCAQRYVIVGMKQNHTLQLWDLGLGKAVQEINFPHENESDAICSINYHHHSGIVVVGHPTRNSIYFIHLSAPKYSLQGVSQAKLAHRLANQDSSLPKPDSTAILSGVREYSFAAKGQLRSVEILPATVDGTVDAERGLFELYVMHSKGVTCLSIRKPDLGWSEESKVITSKNAENEGYVVVRELREVVSQASEPSSVNGESAAPPTARAQTKSKKLNVDTSSKLEAQLGALSLSHNTAPVHTPEKPEKRAKKRRAATHSAEEAAIPPPAPVPPTIMDQPESVAPTPQKESPVKTAEDAVESVASEPVRTESVIAPANSNADAIATPELAALLKDGLGTLRENIVNDYKSLNEGARVKQIELVHLVSEQLGNNVDKALSRIIMANITQSVIPSIHNITAQTLRNEVPEWLSKHLLQTLPAQVKLSLPEAVTKTMSNPDVLKFMSDQITAKISAHVEKQFSNSLQNTIIPSFQSLIIDVAQKKIQESERRINEQIRLVNSQHDETIHKLNQLTSLVQAFTETVHSMASSQAQFQAEVMKSQGHSREQSTAMSAVSSEARSVQPAAVVEQRPEQKEIEAIDEAMQVGGYEQGVIIWLQSKYQTEVFDDYFVRYDPGFLQGCSSLVALSVVAALTITMVKNIPQRLHWLKVILGFIETTDPDIREVAPKIMDVLCSRLETRFMELSEVDPDSTYLRSFPPLTRKARELSKLCAQS